MAFRVCPLLLPILSSEVLYFVVVMIVMMIMMLLSCLWYGVGSGRFSYFYNIT